MVDSIAAQKSFAELIAGNEPVLINFYSNYFGPNQEVKLILEEVKGKMGNKVIILKVDVDKNPKIARQYNIHSIPTLMIFKNDQIIWRQNGPASTKTIEIIIRENLQS